MSLHWADHTPERVLPSVVCLAESDREASLPRRPWPSRGCCTMGWNDNHNADLCRLRLPRGLRRRSAAARFPRLRVRTPPWALVSVSCKCFVLSGRGLCDELITRLEESFCVSSNLMSEKAVVRIGPQRPNTKIYL